jgi:hypothetical protein
VNQSEKPLLRLFLFALKPRHALCGVLPRGPLRAVRTSAQADPAQAPRKSIACTGDETLTHRPQLQSQQLNGQPPVID